VVRFCLRRSVSAEQDPLPCVYSGLVKGLTGALVALQHFALRRFVRLFFLTGGIFTFNWRGWELPRRLRALVLAEMGSSPTYRRAALPGTALLIYLFFLRLLRQKTRLLRY
jgi:hypothetical protein